MSDRPIEALLRPPVEFWSAVTAACCAMAAVLSPPLLLMTPPIAYGAAAGLAWLAVWRFRQGMRVIRYQTALVRLPRYRLAADKIPAGRRHLFLGRGFRWTQKHTQRLRNTQTDEGRRYVEPGTLHEQVRAWEIEWENHAWLRPLARLTSVDVPLNPLRPLPPVGGKPELHGVGALEERDMWMDLRDREGNMLVLGATGVGKTRLAEILITQDIRRGDTVIVFDPKGDADLMRRIVAEAKRAGRENELYLFHLGYPEISARYNPIGEYDRVTEVATRIANQLPGEGNSAAFREFGWLFVNNVARALQVLGRRPDYPTVFKYIVDIEPLFQEYCAHWLDDRYPGWEAEIQEREDSINERTLPPNMRGRGRRTAALVQYLKERRLHDPVLAGLTAAVEHDKTHYDKLVVSLRPLLEKLITGKTADLLAPDYDDLDDDRPIFDWMQVIRRRGIVYVGLDAMADMAVAQAVGNSMFSDLTSLAARIYKHGVDQGLPGARRRKANVSLHADEFNEIIGPEFIPLVNKARGAGFQVTAYTQTWSDIEARMGTAARAGQVEGNFNSLVMLRPRQLATAELLTSRLETVDVKTKMLVSGVHDSSDPVSDVHFTSNNQDRISNEKVPLVHPADVMALPRGQAFALMEGGRLWKLRLPLPSVEDDPAMPRDLDEVLTSMRTRYATGDLWWRGAS
ncbi:MAG: type IV conjugative transfer system coupling protein TraD [Methylothermaceae bacterium]|nr:type IV conjugative transfer system coupling protein TraD [Methylothermaceae bacterium]